MKKIIKKNDTLLIATHNKGKAKEFRKLFSLHSINTIFSYELDLIEPEETGDTFKENSELKAQSAINKGHVVVADDSGLCVKALNNEPGIYSARWADENGGWDNAMYKIYEKLKKKKCANFSAKYYCSLTIAWSEKIYSSYSGEVSGNISWPPKGLNGFGYDPIFLPNNQKLTFGEMTKKEKMKIDHRFKAFTKLIKKHLVC